MITIPIYKMWWGSDHSPIPTYEPLLVTIFSIAPYARIHAIASYLHYMRFLHFIL